MFLGTAPPTSEYLLLNGQAIQRVDYPDLFTVLQVPVGTDLTYLPDYRDRFPVGASGTKAVNSTGQTNLTVTKTNYDTPIAGVTSFVTDVTPVAPLPPWVAVNFFVKAM
jgi:hypothetical protein